MVDYLAHEHYENYNKVMNTINEVYKLCYECVLNVDGLISDNEVKNLFNWLIK